jgi:hypothetical protein
MPTASTIWRGFAVPDWNDHCSAVIILLHVQRCLLDGYRLSRVGI